MLSCLDTMKTPNLVFACPAATDKGDKCTSVLPTEPSGGQLLRRKPDSAVFPKAQAYMQKQYELSQSQAEKQRIHAQLHAQVSSDESVKQLARSILLENEVMRCTFCACPFDSYTGCNAVKCQGTDKTGCGNCFCGICGISLNAAATSSITQTSADRLAHLHAAQFHSSNGLSAFVANSSWKDVAAKLLRTQQVAEAILRQPIDQHHLLVTACVSLGSASKNEELWDFTCLSQVVMMRLMRPNANTPAPALKYFFGQLPSVPLPSGDMSEWFARSSYENYRKMSMNAQEQASAPVYDPFIAPRLPRDLVHDNPNRFADIIVNPDEVRRAFTRAAHMLQISRQRANPRYRNLRDFPDDPWNPVHQINHAHPGMNPDFRFFWER